MFGFRVSSPRNKFSGPLSGSMLGPSELHISHPGKSYEHVRNIVAGEPQQPQLVIENHLAPHALNMCQTQNSESSNCVSTISRMRIEKNGVDKDTRILKQKTVHAAKEFTTLPQFRQKLE